MCVSYAVYAVVIDLGLKGVLVGVPLLAALFAGRAFVGAFLPAAPAAIIAPLGSTLLYERAPGLPFAVAAVLCAGVILVGLLVAPAGRVGET